MKLIKKPVKIETVQMLRYNFCHSFISKKTVYYFILSKFSRLLILCILFENLFFVFFQRGETQREIAVLTDTSKSSVNRTIVDCKNSDSIGPKPRTGSEPKLMKIVSKLAKDGNYLPPSFNPTTEK